MESSYERDFKQIFLLEFTKELIKNYGPDDFFKLKDLIKKEAQREKEFEEKRKQVIRERIKTKKMEVSILGKNIEGSERPIKEIYNIVNKPTIYKKTTPPINIKNLFKIEEPKLPQQFSYLKPVYSNYKIDLGKLNKLLDDPNIKEIECDGPNEHIIVKGTMGIKKVKITLTNEEIKEIINKFSKETNIPIQEGMNRVVLGNLVLTAIVSKVIGSRFLIKKVLNNFQSPPKPIF